jgi:uncharacterized protein YndB with AHSA1/START domain
MATTRVTQRIHAPRPRVYAALLDAEAVRQWMVPDGMTSEVHEFDASEGGTFRITLTYDAPTTSGKTTSQSDTIRGRFTKLVTDTEVGQAVEFETDDPALQGQSRISYRLSDAESDAVTDLVAVHEDVPPGVSAVDNELGWTISIAKLARLVEAAGRPDAARHLTSEE